MNAPAMAPPIALRALTESLHVDAMRTANAMLRRDRAPKTRTREGDLPLGVIGTPMPLAPEPLA